MKIFFKRCISLFSERKGKAFLIFFMAWTGSVTYLQAEEKKSVWESLFQWHEKKDDKHLHKKIKKEPAKEIVVSVYNAKAESYSATPEYAHRTAHAKARCYAIASYSFATKMFGSNGERDGISSLELGSSSLKFSDIAFDVYVGVNGLSIAQDEILLKPFYNALNAFTINFESRMTKTALLLGASRKIISDRFEIGCELPLEQVHHKLHRSFGGSRDYSRWVDLYNASIPGAYGSQGLRLKNITDKLDTPNPAFTFSPTAIDNSAPNDVIATDNYPYNTGKYFSSVFYNDLSLLLDTFLTNKNLEYKENQTVSGVGNIGLYAQMLFDKALVGIKIDVPCSRVYPDTLWKPYLGNGGFCAGKLFAAYAFGHSDLCNPHVYAEFSTYLPLRKSIRLSQAYTNSAADMKVALLSQPYSMTPLPLPVTSSSGTEVQEGAFASNVVVGRVHKGAELSLTCGNIMRGVFFSTDKCDITYTFYVKDSDNLSGDFSALSWDSAGFRADTCAHSHKMSFLWTFYERENMQIEAGGSYVFAGKNVAQKCDLRLRLEYEF